MKRLVKSLDNDSYSSFIMWVLCVIAIQKGNSLLLMPSRKPILDEVLNLGDVHELDVVNVAILLPLHNYVRRDTLIAHSFRVGLVILAVEIDFILHFGWRETIIAFYFI